MIRRTGNMALPIPTLVVAREGQDWREDAALAAEISAMPLAFGTAHNLVERGRVGFGTRLLVAFSGQPLGYAVVRLAAIRGARVVGLCPASRAALGRAAGIRIAENGESLRSKSFDTVIDLDPVQGYRAFSAKLVAGGRYVAPGAMTEPLAQGERRHFYLNEVTRYDRSHRQGEFFAGLITTIDASHLRIVPQQCLKDPENE